MRNKELAAKLRELADRVEACDFDLGPLEEVTLQLGIHSAPNPMAAVDALTDSEVTAHERDRTGWYNGRLGRFEIVAYFDVVDSQSNANACGVML